jgi:hypothetical protein
MAKSEIKMRDGCWEGHDGWYWYVTWSTQTGRNNTSDQGGPFRTEELAKADLARLTEERKESVTKPVSRQHRMELLNEKLRAHPEFEEGMRIHLVPEGGTEDYASGYTWAGPHEKLYLFAEIDKAIPAENGEN